MLIIGESLNATRKDVREAVISHDDAYIMSLAKEQIDKGANMLDVNAAVAGRNESEDLAWMVKTVQSVVDVPLVLDSSDPDALVSAMKVHRGSPMINSLSAESEKIESLLPVVCDFDCDVIVLCMDDSGIPNDVDTRIVMARKAVEPLLKAGKRADQIYLDPLVMSVSVDTAAPKKTLELYQLFSEGVEGLEGVNTTGGLSNVSFGMPNRRLLNSLFLTMAIAMGMNSCLVDVRNQALMSGIYGAMALLDDKAFKNYLKMSRKGQIIG
jgi:5-methyltetrahydrofolate--homocysteine methyltransferase